MTRSSRAKLALLTVLAVVASTLALLPALGDPGPEVVRLDLSPTGQHFTFDGTIQAITSDRCAIDALSLAGSLVTVGPAVSNDNNKNNRPGVNAFGIGYKSGSSQGTPCGRVSEGEPAISFAVSQSGLLKGRVWDKVRFDLEVKGSAVVKATLTGGGEERVFTLFTGRSDAPDASVDVDGFTATSTSGSPNALCRSGADSGPDSGANDNCLWTIDPSGPFDTVTLEAIAGEFSVEGGYDFRSQGGFTDPLGYDFNTVFFLVANRAPVANDDGLDGVGEPLAAYTTDEDTLLTVVVPGVLANDTDPDGDSLTAVLVSGPSKGALALNANGSFTYDPNGEFEHLGDGEFATETFTYEASDGALESNTATVTITITGVNDAPTAVDDGLDGEGEPLAAYSTNRDEVLDVVVTDGILANDTDPEDDTLTVAEVNGEVTDVGVEVTLASGALLTMRADGSLSYDPNGKFDTLGQGQSDIDTFTYRASDGALSSNEATVTITINGVNFVPVAVDDEYSTGGVSPFSVPETCGVPLQGILCNDTDADDDELTVAEVNGSTLNVGVPVDLTWGTVTVSVGGGFTYTPDLGVYGVVDTFTYKASDGISTSNLATVTIVVPLVCNELITFGGGDEPLYTIRMEPNLEVCPPKDAEFSAGADGTGQFVQLEPIDPTGVVYAFLERIQWLPVAAPGEAGPQIPFVLQYDDIPPFELLRDAPWCLQDPRTVLDGVPQFDLDDDLVESEIAAFMAEGTSTVLPVGHTTCIIEAIFVTVDIGGNPFIKPTYWLFNLGDGKRTFQ